MKKHYIKKLDMELSPLGFDAMRLPMKGDEFTEETYSLMPAAMKVIEISKLCSIA